MNAQAHFTRTQPSANLLTQITLGSSILASKLVHNYDRIGLAYIDWEKSLGFELLLSLGFHSLDAVRSALNFFSVRQHPNHGKTSFGNGDIIHRVSRLLSICPRTAYCHLFFVSATPPIHLEIPWIDQAIGLHTITPQPHLSLKQSGLQPGWHISHDFGNDNTCPGGAHFIRKVSRVVRQLRTGIRPGSILDLNLSIIPGEGCHVLSIIENSRLTSLRPGETWIFPIEISVPSAFHSITSSDRNQSPAYHPSIEDMISQINVLLMEYSSGNITQSILTAHVEYHHSFLPATSTINEETQLTVIRGENSILKPSIAFRQTSLSTIASGNDLSVGLSAQSGSK